MNADEYGAAAGGFEQLGNQPGGEPHQPNVTTQTDPAQLKWIGAVTTSPVPMLRNSDCSQENKWNTLPSDAWCCAFRICALPGRPRSPCHRAGALSLLHRGGCA